MAAAAVARRGKMRKGVLDRLLEGLDSHMMVHFLSPRLRMGL